MTLKSYVLLAGLVLSAFAGKTQPITDAQALDAGHALEKVTNNGDSYALNYFFCADSLLERIRQKSKFLQNPAAFDGFKSSYVPGLHSGNFGKQIQINTHNGSYRLIREFDQGGRKHLLFRIFGDGGLNYHDFILTRVGDSIKAADLYSYITDGWTSSSMAMIADLMGQSSDPLSYASVLKKMGEQARSADYTGVISTYETLGPELKHNKSIQAIYISACHHIDLVVYQKALEDYAATFPDAASSYLMMLDLYYMQKQYDKALFAVNKLDTIVGGDPLLDLFRGNIYVLMNKPAEALVHYEKAYRYDPTLKINVLKLAGQYAAVGQKDKAQKVINAYVQTPGYHTGDLNTLYDQYPDLK
jgi:tetratricopeptide (TPR) repeat protein